MINIDNMPQMSSILSGLFKQLQMAALFTQYFETAPREPTESFLERFGSRPALLNSILTATEMYRPGSVVTDPVPAVANRAHWSSPQDLGGYLSVKPNELLASYLGTWNLGAQSAKSCPFRLIRVGFWYWHRTNDVFAALGLLFDLNRSGFFLQATHFAQAVFKLCDAYTRDFNIDLLENHNFESQSADDDLTRVLEDLSPRPHNPAKVQAAIEWVQDYAIDSAQRAREAKTPDEWFMHHSLLAGPAEILVWLDREHKTTLTIAQRAIASQFEEIGADLGAVGRVTWLAAREYRPLQINFSGAKVVALSYRRTYGGEWLDKLLEDRVLLPEALRDAFAAAYDGGALNTLPKVSVPPDWQQVSEWIAWSLAVAAERDPFVLRTCDFDGSVIKTKCEEMGFAPEGTTKFHEFSSEAQSEARYALIKEELAGLIHSPDVFSDDAETAIKKLQEILSLYPWNNFARLELGIRYDQTGHVAEGFREIRASILLEPTYALAWKSLSVVLNRLGNRQDAILAAAISEMIAQRRADE